MYVKQAGNVVELLEFFAGRRRPATLAEIADGLGWPRSSTFNLIGTLVGKGYFYEPKSRGGFYPSASWLRKAEAISGAEPLPAAVEELVHEVALATGETACIAAPAGVSALLIFAVESQKPIRHSPWMGQTNPIHASASGRALLSQYTPAERQALYRKISFEPRSPPTRTSAAEVEAALRTAAACGYHVSIGEVMDEVMAIAVPLPVNGRALALVVSGPIFRCLDKTEAFGLILRDKAAGFLAGNIRERTAPPRAADETLAIPQ